jgi:hypothetical protein
LDTEPSTEKLILATPALNPRLWVLLACLIVKMRGFVYNENGTKESIFD